MTSCRIITLILCAILCLNRAEYASAQNDQTSLHVLFGADALASNVNAVRRKAAGMSEADRYEYLQSWVLPSVSHPDYRVVGEFTPTDPSPLVLKLEPYRFHADAGGELVSPVFDLLDTAKSLGRLDELELRVQEILEPVSNRQLRARLVVQLLIDLEKAKASETRDERMTRLTKLTIDSFTKAGDPGRPIADWPELLLIVRGMSVHSEFQLIGDLLSGLYAGRMSISSSRRLQTHLHALMMQYQRGVSKPTTARRRLQDWIPVTQTIAMSRGQGYPQPRWVFDEEGQLILAAGNNEEYFFYRSPLTGKFDVVSEMADAGVSQILVGGQFLGTLGDGKRLISGIFRSGGKLIDVEYPARRHDATIRYRAEVSPANVEISINGKDCLAYPLDEIPDPWIGVRSMPMSSAVYRDVVISGKPTIPDTVEMLSSPTLHNWLPYYLFSDSAGTPQSRWTLQGDPQNGFELICKRRENMRGTGFESLLRYHRPLVEDGSIEYEFFYLPGRCEAHPALDRLVFLMEPHGVRLHWLTDGKFDRTPVSPDHSVVEPDNRRGPAELPLKENAWNRLKLSVTGGTVSLVLNEELVYERELETSNRRTFGLFHYADRSELRVRDAVMRGDWPKSLPLYYEQELAKPGLAEIERNRERLPAEFRHDFVRDGLPGDFFELQGANAREAISARPDGVHVQMSTVSRWRSAHIVPRFSVSGDFDIQASLEIREMDHSLDHALAFLELRLDDELQHYVRSLTGWDAVHERNLRSQVSPLQPDGTRLFLGQTRVDWAQSGRLRITRIGKQYSIMFAPDDSEVFQVIEAPAITDADVMMQGVVLQLALNGRGSGHIVWKDLSIKAEQLKYLKPGQSPTRKLFSMSPDGKNLHELAAPRFGLDHLGSPEFSADGSRIVMDLSRGPTISSHVVIMNRDGSNMKDLGTGCMPSLSRDGKSIVFSAPGSGIMKMDADGENRETIERAGWGVQYSPDGKQIAYGSDSNITLIDPQTGKKTPLLAGEPANRYSRIYWNFGWSHDSQAIAFKGHVKATGQEELAVVDINKPDKVEVLYTGSGIYEDFTFSPDSESVLFALRQNGPTQPDLYLAHRKTPGQIERLKGQPDDYKILDCDWSPDGKEIVFAALVDPAPVEWPLDENRTDR